MSAKKVQCGVRSTGLRFRRIVFECMGCTRKKELEVELELLRLLVVAMVGREQVGCASGSGGGKVDDKVGEDEERDARESSNSAWEEAERR